MKCLSLLFVFIYSTSVLALEEINLPSVAFIIKANRVVEKLETTARDPEGLLRRYTPGGVTVIQKRVHHNKMDMIVSKSYVIISKQVKLSATLDVNPYRTINRDQYCYNIKLDFMGSDEIVTANVDSLKMVLCADMINERQINIRVWPTIVKAPTYNSLIGGKAQVIIADQMNPIIDSIRSGILSLK